MAPTVVGVEQHLVELGLAVVKGLSDFVDHLLVCQVAVHEAAKGRRTQSWQRVRLTGFLSNKGFEERLWNGMTGGFDGTTLTCTCCSCA